MYVYLFICIHIYIYIYTYIYIYIYLSLYIYIYLQSIRRYQGRKQRSSLLTASVLEPWQSPSPFIGLHEGDAGSDLMRLEALYSHALSLLRRTAR